MFAQYTMFIHTVVLMQENELFSTEKKKGLKISKTLELVDQTQNLLEMSYCNAVIRSRKTIL